MRICKTLLLKDDPDLIAEYISHHAEGNAWPEISAGMKAIGIVDMEIYITGNRLFMIMDVVDNFDHSKAFAELSTLPRQHEWESLMSKYQSVGATETAAEKWEIIKKIYKLD